jgi:hypothetical protein
MSGYPEPTAAVNAPSKGVKPARASADRAEHAHASGTRWRWRLLAPARAFRRLPGAARLCALVAIMSAVCWSVITPPFEAPDEPAHFAYVQQLAETGSLPSVNGGNYSQAQEAAERGLLIEKVLWHPEAHTVSTPAQQKALEEYLALPLARTDGGNAGVATSEPPLYYALQVIPYDIGSFGNVLDSLALMRLLSVLMAGFTAFFIYLFTREALPGAPWAWTVAGLSAALAPLLGFMSGIVNPDSMLYAVSAATFFCLARGFRAGLTPRLTIGLGAVVALGILTKVNYVGLLPGVIVGAIVLVVRARRSGPLPRRFYSSLLIALAIPALPIAAYVVKNLAAGQAPLGLISSAVSLTSAKESLLGELRYIWEFYLPRLPGMKNEFNGIMTTRDIWFDRSVGLYGWLDTTFAPWVDNLALIPAGLLAILGMRSLLVGRDALRRRLGEVAVYLLMTTGLMTLLASDSYLNRSAEGAGWAQPRYLMPLLPLLAGFVALAARGAGRKWGPAVGALIITLVLAQDIFSQLQTVARFYG